LDQLTAIFLSPRLGRSHHSLTFLSLNFFDALCETVPKHPTEIRYNRRPWRETAPPPAQLVLSLNRRKAATLNDPTVGESHARKLPAVSECGTLFARRRL
jgi:hypothetical protein